MNVLDLFSGIGGFSLGLERAGMRTVAFCEIDPFCRRVLAKHWPHVPCYDDVRTLTADRLRSDGIAADVICGGFPCQDISFAGQGAGLDGERSGLWREITRLASELRPQYIIVENVAALLGRGLDRVLGDLAALGFDAEWHCIPASSVGAPHIRDRVWIMAYPAEDGWWNGSGAFAHQPASRGNPTAHQWEHIRRQQPTKGLGIRLSRLPALLEEASSSRCSQWMSEPELGRVADGLPNELAGVGALGNAVIPQISEIIGRAIMKAQSQAA